MERHARTEYDELDVPRHAQRPPRERPPAAAAFEGNRPLVSRGLSAGAVLALQCTAGNRAVGQLLVRQELPEDAGASLLAKILGGEEELEKRQDVGEPECPGATHIAAVPQERGSSDVTVEVEQVETGAALDRGPADLAKAVTSVAGGAVPSVTLAARGPNVYGLTFPESVVPTITAKLDRTAGTWSPKVSALTGNFSMQVRLLDGQTEITGPGGNTSEANHCDQAANLKSLGNIIGNRWYMLAAVTAHENVHAARFGVALKKVEPAITTALEAVEVSDVPGMTAATAVTALEGDFAYQVALLVARALWDASVDVEVAGDHAPGGPCDKAEQTVTEPMRRTICAFAKQEHWPACGSC